MIKTLLKHVIYETAIDVVFSNILRSFNKPNGYNLINVIPFRRSKGDKTWMAIIRKDGLDIMIDLGFSNSGSRRKRDGAKYTFDILTDFVAVHGEEKGNEFFYKVCSDRVEELV
jgi:hypothetical protein